MELVAIITIPAYIVEADLVAHLDAEGMEPKYYRIVGRTVLCFHPEVATLVIGFWY